MRNGLALLSLVFCGVLFGTASCGGDEATGPQTTPKAAYCEPCDATSDCGGGMKCKEIGKGSGLGACAKADDTQCCTGDGKTCRTGLGTELTGAGGSGGIIGGGGKGGKGGAGGSGGGGVKQTHLGQNCVTDADCGDDNLTCLGSTSLSDGTGVPKGLCTMPCTTGADCLDHYDNSFCFQFNDNDMYCIEGCTTGSAGSPKCHSRPEIACSLIGLFPTGTACTSTSDCGSLQLCDSDTSQCGDIVTGCVPQCGGDFDCGAKEFCDFSTGMCTKKKPTGLPLGSVCTPPTGNQPDPCQGFCDPGDDPKSGICGGLCSLSPTFAGCGWDGDVGNPPDNVCLFGTILSPPGDSVTGDVGLCGALCDCNAECLRKGDYCVDETGGQVKSRFDRNGYCRPLDPASETEADSFRKCPAGSTGGTGGGGGAGGEPGTTGGTGGTGGGSGAGSGGEGGEPTSPNGGQSGGN